MSGRLHPWPEGVGKTGATDKFAAACRAAFDASPAARFCAAEVDGVTIVVAVGRTGQKVQEFVEDELNGEIERGLPRRSPRVGLMRFGLGPVRPEGATR